MSQAEGHERQTICSEEYHTGGLSRALLCSSSCLSDPPLQMSPLCKKSGGDSGFPSEVTSCWVLVEKPNEAWWSTSYPSTARQSLTSLAYQDSSRTARALLNRETKETLQNQKNKEKTKVRGARETAQWLRVHAVVTEDPSLVGWHPCQQQTAAYNSP